jgi:hypothetical protein
MAPLPKVGNGVMELGIGKKEGNRKNVLTGKMEAL